jgi:hypothetical protein
VKRSGSNEQTWVVIQLCMEVMLGISLYNYIYLKLTKTICLSYYLLCFLFNKIREQEGGWNMFCQEVGKGVEGESGTNNVYTCE